MSPRLYLGSIVVLDLYLYILIYIYLSSNPKLFADDTSLFSVVRDLNTSAIEINGDLKKIEAWTHQWKMISNPDPLMQAREVIFSRKRNKPIILILFSTAIW